VSHPLTTEPLGTVLQHAGLVSSDQVKQALEKQKQNRSVRIGRILASQGRIKPETADFFADHWSTLVSQKPKQPLGQYFKQAALLSEQQIELILEEQKQTNLRFGELAIAKRWLKQTTVDFFLKYLAPESQSHSELNALNAVEKSKVVEQLEYSKQIQERFLKIRLKLFQLEEKDGFSQSLLEEVLFWTGGQSFLTQKLFQLISNLEAPIDKNQETDQVKHLIQTRLLNDWENQELGEHLKAVRNRLLNNQQCEPVKLLKLYQQLLQQEITADESQEQRELLNSGLAVKHQQKLKIANRIYQSVFAQSWTTQQLTKLSSASSLPVSVTSSDIVPVRSPRTKNKNKLFNPRNIFLLLTLASLFIVLNIWIKRMVSVQQAFHRGNELLNLGSFDKAISEYNRLLNIDSNYYQAWTNRGYALAGLQKYDEMRESCQTATIIDPNALYAWNCQGEALRNLQRDEEAIIAFEQAISLNRTDPIFLINKSESLVALNKEKESFATIQEAVNILEEIEAVKGKEKIGGEFAVALSYQGNGYRRKQQYQAAIAAYNRALEYAPNYFPAQIGRGITFKHLKRYQESGDEFKRILKNSQLTKTQKAQTWFYLGKTLCESSQKQEGIAAFEQAIKLKPDYKVAETAKMSCK
jgi:tetratricopeptide (TPR) repeat protein